MSDLDRLLELCSIDADDGEVFSELDSKEYDSLKAKIEGQIQKGSELEFIIENRLPSKDLVRFIVFLLGSDQDEKFFGDEEFKKNWFGMLRRLEKIQ